MHLFLRFIHLFHIQFSRWIIVHLICEIIFLSLLHLWNCFFIIIASSLRNCFFVIAILLLLLNFYSLWHRHKMSHAKIFIYFIWKKNFNEKKKSLVFNFIATKIVVDKSTITCCNDVYAHSLLFSSISNTKNRLRDKSNERVFELLQTFFNQRKLN
jgi:hypothetical protein